MAAVEKLENTPLQKNANSSVFFQFFRPAHFLMFLTGWHSRKIVFLPILRNITSKLHLTKIGSPRLLFLDVGLNAFYRNDTESLVKKLFA